MIKIYDLNENFISFEIPSVSSIPLASSVLSKIKEDIYLDWEFVLEELNETVEGGVLNKKINIFELKESSKERLIIISVEEYDLVAVVPS